MFLVDNAVVREDWGRAKSTVTGILEKHGATVLSARRWDERRLAYPIKGKHRATFLLAYYNIPAQQIPAMRRDFELNETVLRTLELVVDAVPETEAEFVTAEASPEFKVPTPPDDDHVEFVEEPEDEGRPRRRDEERGERSRDSRDSREGAKTEGPKDGDSKPGTPEGESKTKGKTPTEGSQETVNATEEN